MYTMPYWLMKFLITYEKLCAANYKVNTFNLVRGWHYGSLKRLMNMKS